MQGTQVRSLIQEDATCLGATTPMRPNYQGCAPEPLSHNPEPMRCNYSSPRAYSLCSATREAAAMRGPHIATK